MFSLLINVSIIFAVVFAAVFSVGSFFARRMETSGKNPAKFFLVIAAMFALYVPLASSWLDSDERQAEAEVAARKEFRELVQARCIAATRQYEDALMTRENYGSLSGTQQARMGREWGADGTWVEDQVSKARTALGDCERGLKAEKAAIYRSHGLSIEK